MALIGRSADRDWIELRARGKGATKDEAISLLVRAGSPGVVEDTGAKAGYIISHSFWEEALIGEPGEKDGAPPRKAAALTAYLPWYGRPKLNTLKKELNGIGWKFTSSDYRDSDWSVKWRSRLRPVRITEAGSSIVIRPRWSKAGKKTADTVIEIDPGMAFGTGGHATTRMCLKALLWVVKRGYIAPANAAFLDVGTGSGTLSIAAKKLEVKKVTAVDIDRVALEVARKNARANNAAVTISAKPVEEIKGRFSTVAANILSRELLRLAPALKKRLKDNGFIILSGILKDELNAVESAYASLGLHKVRVYSSRQGGDSWIAAVFSQNKKP